MCITFLLTATKPTDSIAGDLVSARDHLVQTFIPKIGLEATLYDCEQILHSIFSGLSMKFYAPVEPADCSPHGLFYSRAHSQTGYCENVPVITLPFQRSNMRLHTYVIQLHDDVGADGVLY